MFDGLCVLMSNEPLPSRYFLMEALVSCRIVTVLLEECLR